MKYRCGKCWKSYKTAVQAKRCCDRKDYIAYEDQDDSLLNPLNPASPLHPSNPLSPFNPASPTFSGGASGGGGASGSF
jgi:hypothetical protein